MVAEKITKHRLSAQTVAWRIVKERWLTLLSVAGFQLLTRAAALSPLLLNIGVSPSDRSVSLFRFEIPIAGKYWFLITLALCVPLYWFIVMPFRFKGAGDLCKLFGHAQRKTDITVRRYRAWLRAGLRRWFGGLPYGLLFIALTGLFYYWWNIADVTVMPKALKAIGAFVGGEEGRASGELYRDGLLVFLGAYLFSGLFFAFNWWRNVPFDFQPISEIGIRRSRERARDVKRYIRLKMLRNLFFNILLTLPAILAFVVPLWLNIRSKMTSSTQMNVSVVLNLFARGIPTSPLIVIIILEIFLYLPFAVYRKLCNAATVQNGCKRRDGMRVVDTSK